jgi:hypothetical protein
VASWLSVRTKTLADAVPRPAAASLLPVFVIPAKAGTQARFVQVSLGSRLRGNDEAGWRVPPPPNPSSEEEGLLFS